MTIVYLDDKETKHFLNSVVTKHPSLTLRPGLRLLLALRNLLTRLTETDGNLGVFTERYERLENTRLTTLICQIQVHLGTPHSVEKIRLL